MGEYRYLTVLDWSGGSCRVHGVAKLAGNKEGKIELGSILATRSGRTRCGVLRTRFRVHKLSQVPHRVASQGNATYCEPGLSMCNMFPSESIIYTPSLKGLEQR